MMTIEKFIELFHEQLDETDISKLTPTTNFRELEEWSSLTALAVIAMTDDEFGVQLKGEEIRNSKTIEDLFNIIKSKT